MKYRVSAKKIKAISNKLKVPDTTGWIEKVDGEIIDESDFMFDEIACCKGKLIHKRWCEPIENVSCETTCNNKNIIEKIKEYCKSNIKRIDDMTDAGFSTDVDTGTCYAYGRILDLIEREEKKHD